MRVCFSNGMAAWQGVTTCSTGPRPGARALLAYWLEQWEPLAFSMGIYNCRPVRGSGSLSIHSDGRAVDGGVPVNDEGHAIAYDFLTKIAPHAKRLGIQLMIFNRTIWSARRDPCGEAYGGIHPHRDHWHGELNRAAADQLTLATLRAVVGDFRHGQPEPEPEPILEDIVDPLLIRRASDSAVLYVNTLGQAVGVTHSTLLDAFVAAGAKVDDKGNPFVVQDAAANRLPRLDRA